MSPGDFAKGGEGLRIFWGWFESPFGPALVMGTEKGICGMGFAAETGEAAAMEDLVGRWPRATFVEDPMMLRPWVLQAFGATHLANSDTPLFLIGAPFQIKVWEALLHIPSGPCHHLFRNRGRSRPPARGARRGHGGGAQSDQLADPLPPGLAQVGRPWRLSLGPAASSGRCWPGKRRGRTRRKICAKHRDLFWPGLRMKRPGCRQPGRKGIATRSFSADGHPPA